VPRPPTPVGSFGAITHIQRPDGTWSARTYIRDTDGNRRLVARRGRTRAAADRALKTALTDRTPPTQGTLSASTPVRELAERWFANVQQEVTDGTKSPNTARLYRHYLDRHILPGIGALRLSEATVPRLDEFITAVRKRSGTAAAKACRSALSSMLGQAARHGAIPTNPVRDIGRLPGVRRTVKARSLTLAECRRWIAQLEADPAAARRDLPDLTRWLLATGVRIGEAIAVDWSSIDMERATVEIDYKVMRVKGAGLRRTRRTKSDAGHRTLPLPAFAMNMLERRRATSGGTGPLFPDNRGGWRDPSNLSRELRQARGSGEFAWVTSHVFRKTCATLLDEGDLSARQIADQLGHSKVSMTQDNYLGRRLTSRRTAETLDRAFGQSLR
jgi:integrase